jgi:hypothetical protein
MENYFEISIGHGKDLKTFEVKDYAHHEGDQCKFEVFSSGKLVLSLEPDGRFLRTCQNPGGLDEDIIHAIMDNIEALHL